MKYRVLSHLFPSDLEIEVEKLLKIGWKLVGVDITGEFLDKIIAKF